MWETRSQNIFVSYKSLESHPALSWFLHWFMYHYNQSYNQMWSWDGCTAQHLTCPFRISERDIPSCVACLRQVDLATPIPLQFKLQPMSSNLTALRLATSKKKSILRILAVPNSAAFRSIESQSQIYSNVFGVYFLLFQGRPKQQKQCLHR